MLSESEDEGDAEDQKVILGQLAALERAHGLYPEGSLASGPGTKGWVTLQAVRKQFQVEVRNRFLCLA